jgi:mono/diheme cytochrome c family protein
MRFPLNRAMAFITLGLLLTPLAQAEEAPTWNGEIGALIYENCASCHRPGQGAPFSLLSFDDASKRAQMIAAVVEQGVMPPWHPTQGREMFLEGRALSAAQIKKISAWAEAGAPEGKEQPAPTAPAFPEGWKLGKPDLIVTMNGTFTVPADGPDIYRSFIGHLDLPDDRWVTAVELKSTAPEVTHHVLFFASDSISLRAQDGKDGQAGFRSMGFQRNSTLGGWAVGGQPHFLPEGLGRPLPKHTDFVFNSHFHPDGREHTVSLSVGLHFAKKKPERTIFDFQVPPLYGRFSNIDIAPGQANWVLEDKFEVPTDIELVSVAGHAHYICRSMKAWAVLPDGAGEKLLFEIKDWDFNWQERYTYRDRLVLPKGSVIHCRIVYDNSAENPNNPFSPPQRITWGLESTDEMGSVIFNALTARESDLPDFKRASRQQFLRGQGAQLKMLVESLLSQDKNNDGILTIDELPGRFRSALERLDKNRDGVLDRIEVESLGEDSGPPLTDQTKRDQKNQPAPPAKPKRFF